jgi:hypothetical protein
MQDQEGRVTTERARTPKSGRVARLCMSADFFVARLCMSADRHLIFMEMANVSIHAHGKGSRVSNQASCLKSQNSRVARSKSAAWDGRQWLKASAE